MSEEVRNDLDGLDIAVDRADRSRSSELADLLGVLSVFTGGLEQPPRFTDIEPSYRELRHQQGFEAGVKT